MTSELLAGLALIVLFAVISGRSTATRLFGFSCCSLKICVSTWSPRTEGALTETTPVCSFASASGTTFRKPPDSTTVKPRPRSADR